MHLLDICRTYVKEQNVTCTCVKVCIALGILYLVCRQLRFSLCSGAVTTKALTMVVFLYYPLSLALWCILCLMHLAYSPAVLSGGVLCSSACPLVICLMQLSLSEDLGFCKLFYLGYCCTALWDGMSGLCALWDNLSTFPNL